MKIFCFATNIHPECKRALKLWGHDYEIVPIERYDPWHYGREVGKRWDDPEDMVIIEHDIEISPRTIGDLRSCPNDWCSFSYDIWGVDFPYGIGCTKLSARARSLIQWPEHIYWYDLDWYINKSLYEHGITPCIHGKVKHHHQYTASTSEVIERSKNQIKALVKSHATGVFKDDLTMFREATGTGGDITVLDPATGKMIPYDPEIIRVYRDTDTGREWAETRKRSEP